LAINNVEIEKIINEVVKRLSSETPLVNVPVSQGTAGSLSVVSANGPFFSTVKEAISAARQAHEKLVSLTLKKRVEIINNIRQRFRNEAKRLAEETVLETGMGRVEHKIAKIILAVEKTPGVEILEPRAMSGDAGLTLEERAPYGVIASVTPSTNPVPTIINNGISMLAGGNAIVFAPHPGAKKVTQEAIRIFNSACKEVGGPENIATSVIEPDIQKGMELMGSPDIDLLVVTGGPGVVNAALKMPVRAICAGPGNPPVVVDETADIPKAAKHIVDGATFDNNILCTAEKEIFAVERIFEELAIHLERSGAYRLSPEQLQAVERLIITSDNKVNKKFVGKNADYIAAQAGINVPSTTRMLLAYDVPFNHPFVQHELLMPVIPLVRVRSVDEAIELAIQAEHGFRHSAIMHSKNLDNLHKMARAIKTTIFTKNGPSYAGLSFGGEGYTTLTIAGTTGEGLTNALTFTKQRRCVLVDYFRIV
jgi:propionaldehyde dehydrogenase